mmetsp:Transcript_38272/g.83255  ORF Transcript_38272/g.83255 Transcript_38272/m.83255 type:complete len:255 (+) Transcript_38272:133-897(+)
MVLSLCRLRAGPRRNWCERHNTVYTERAASYIRPQPKQSSRMVCEASSRPSNSGSGSQDREGVSSSSSSSSYEGTSTPVKMLVSSLTAVVNAIFDDGAGEREAEEEKEAISVEYLVEGLKSDYTERNYLWTGNIDANLYDSDCVFTDPTLSFQGLATFQRNVKNLQPVLKVLVSESATTFRGIRRIEGAPKVEAEWRMTGTFRLPWKPELNLDGRTLFTYEEAKGNRVVRYDEFWQLSARDALLQLVTPGRRNK